MKCAQRVVSYHPLHKDIWWWLMNAKPVHQELQYYILYSHFCEEYKISVKIVEKNPRKPWKVKKKPDYPWGLCGGCSKTGPDERWLDQYPGRRPYI